MALTLITSGAVAGGDVPRGRRGDRVVPTRVVVAEAECAAGDATIVLRPGVGVAAPAKLRARGTVRVELAGKVSARCAIDVDALGLRVAADTEIEHGVVYEGALVRVLRGKAPRGTVRVESAGAARATFELPADALTAEPREFVYRAPPTRDFVTPFSDTTLYAKPASVGTNAPPVGVIAGGVEVVLLEQQGATAKVRSHGPVEIEGWGLNKQFAARGAEATAELLKPTHEVFVGAPLFAEPGAREPFATLRGGALVEVNATEGARAKVTTTEGVIASGWVDADELRAIATSVD